MKYPYNCKNSGVYMVKVFGLVAITCLINGPFDNDSTRMSNGHVSVRRVSQTFNVRLNNHSIIRYVSSLHVKIEH